MVVVLLAIISLGGLSWLVFGIGFSALGLVFTVYLALFSYGSKLVVALWIGKLITQSADTPARTQRLVGGLVGIVLYVILHGIPVLGWIIGLAVTMIGLGAMVLWYREVRSGVTPSAAASEAVTADA
jgi:hypothetical protein